jgi:hypothetical protein
LPVQDAQIRDAVDAVALDAARGLQLVEPARQQDRRIAVVREELLYKRLGIEPQAAGIVGLRLEQDEEPPRLAGEAADGGGVREGGGGGAETSHEGLMD